LHFPYCSGVALSVRTLLFSDIEGSTALLDRAGGEYSALLGIHRRIVRAAVEHVGGIEHGTEGDSFFLSFDSPTAGLAAAVEAQRAIETYEWPDGLRLRVRMGVHLGEVREETGQDLVGMSIHHAARIAATAHGGQIVLSDTVRQLVRELPEGVEIRPLGTHRLRDVGAVALFQVDHPDLQHDFPAPRGVVGYRTNLPRSRTPFIGGEGLLEAIAEQFSAASVVTLTGTGGVGKTRAAIEFGHVHLVDFDQGVFFVDLAPVSDTGAVVGALASTLPIVAGGEQLLLETILDWIGERRVLLVIDNCEHLVAEVGELVEELTASCSNLQILATSREALGVQGERVHRVPSLDVDGAAVELFCERTRATDGSFTPEGHFDALVQICQRLDGIPLAIELAAARMRSLSAEELLERLQDRFRLLRGSGRGTFDRHQTLRATVSWSYQLLTDDERLLFDRVSVFAGGFDLRAAETVCGFDPIDDLDVIDLVGSLVDKSMIVADRGAVGMRYRLLETLRQYGEDQLELRGETTVLRDRHAAHYADLIAELDLLVRGARQIEGSARITLEWDNLRAAHLWSLAQGDLDLAERLVVGSFEHAVFSMRHEHASMLQRTVQLGEQRDRPSTRILGMLSYWVDMQGQGELALIFAQRGIDAAPSPDHPATATCWFAFSAASATIRPGSPEAQAAFQRHVAAVANTPDLDLNWFALVNLIDSSLHADPTATPALLQRVSDMSARVQCPRLTTFARQYDGHASLTLSPPDFAAAIPAYEQAGEIARATGDRQFQAIALRCLAMASTGLGAPDARARCHDALAELFEIRYWQKTWQTLESVTLTLARAGRTEQAAVVLGHLDAHSPGLGLEDTLHFRDQAREFIDAAGGHAAARLRGERMSADELVTTALAYCSADPQ
jgi:predicted ATPase/class 3 adenylate cyclase